MELEGFPLCIQTLQNHPPPITCALHFHPVQLLKKKLFPQHSVHPSGLIMYKQSWLQSQATWGATHREHRSVSLPQGCPPELCCQARGEHSLLAGNTASWQETAVLGELCLPMALLHDKVLSAGRVDRPFLHFGAGGGVGITSYPQPPEMFLATWTCAGPLHFNSCCSAVKLNFVATLRAGDIKIETFSAVSKLCTEGNGLI